MSSIRTRNGKLVFDFNYQGIRCRETSKLNDTPANKKIAKNILAKIDAEILIGTFNYAEYFPRSKKLKVFEEVEKQKSGLTNNLPTLYEFTHIWLEENSGGWRPTYLKKLKQMFNKYIWPALGSKMLSDITLSDLKLFRNDLVSVRKKNGKPLSNDHINKLMMKLAAVLAEASTRFKIENPGANLKALKKSTVEVFPLSLNEVTKFLAIVREDHHCYFTVRFFTGLRSSEIHGLQWRDVYLDEGYLMVRRALVNGELIDTKTELSFRKVELSPVVLESLIKHKQNGHFTSDEDFVFCKKDGKPLNNNTVCQKVWHPMLRLLDLKPRKLYQTRHTTATLWLASGESPEWISKQLGHKNTALLFSTYSQYVANNTHRDGTRFEQFLKEVTK